MRLDREEAVGTSVNHGPQTIIPAEQLSTFVSLLLEASGLAPGAAKRVAEGLVEADLEGIPSHGVMLVEMYVNRIRNGSVSTSVSGSVLSDRGVAIVVDAGHALGQLTGDQAIDMAVARARELGAGIVAVRHGFHFGAARRYALAAAAADCIGITMCNTRPLMPAPGGAEKVVGNNPLAIAVPAGGRIPIVLDMATSEAAMGKIRMAAKTGRPIPPTWAAKADGSPTTDPGEAINGMLLPCAGPKGFGLAFVIDLMCGLLSGGAFGDRVRPLYGDPAEPYDCSHLFIAIDLRHFGDPVALRATAAAAAERIRKGLRAPGVDRLFTPGEPEWRRREAAAGQVYLDQSVAQTLLELAGELGVPADLLDETAAAQREREGGHAQT